MDLKFSSTINSITGFPLRLAQVYDKISVETYQPQLAFVISASWQICQANTGMINIVKITC